MTTSPDFEIGIPLLQALRTQPLDECLPPRFRHAVIIDDLRGSQEIRKLPYRPGNCPSGFLVLQRIRLGVDCMDVQAFGLAVHARVDAPDEAVAVQDGEDVVAVLALGWRHVYLYAVAKVEYLLGALAVANQVVEG